MKLNRCFLRDANASREKTTTTKKKNLICRCARDPQPKRNPTSIPKSKARAVVVGGGWAGFGAAWNLSKSGWQVTLVDVSPAPGGLAGSADQGQIELGIKGLWYHYKNIRAILRELGLEEIYGDFAETGFYSPRGLEVASPIFSKQPIRLPAPLGPLAYTANRFQVCSKHSSPTFLPALPAPSSSPRSSSSFTLKLRVLTPCFVSFLMLGFAVRGQTVCIPFDSSTP